MKIVVLTGATSFLGLNLLNKLLLQGYMVYALVRKESPSQKKLPQADNFKLIYGSMDEIEILEDCVSSADVFIHFAWDGSGNQGRACKEIQQKNIHYSMRALDVANNLGCTQFIFSGSQAEYGKSREVLCETALCNPISEYGKAKLRFSCLAEEFCKNKMINFVHLRIFSVYGVGDRTGTLVDSCINKFNNGEVMHLGPCKQYWNYLYIEDFVNIILKIIEKQCTTGIYNIASTDTRVLREFVEEIYAMSNQTGAFEFGKHVANPEGSPELRPDISKLEENIGGMDFISFRQGIRKIMEEKVL